VQGSASCGEPHLAPFFHHQVHRKSGQI